MTFKIDVSKLPVMKACCGSCPFKEVNGRAQDQQLANQVIERTLFKGHQICHGTEGKNREPKNRCKGARLTTTCKFIQDLDFLT